jgi:hypothetical protein
VDVAIAGPGLTTGLIEIGGLAGTLLLLAPVVVLAIVMVRVSRTRGARPAPGRQGEKPAPGEQPSGKPVPGKSVSGKTLAERIRATDAAHDEATLAGLNLSRAREALEAGRTGEAAEHLRASIRAGAAAHQTRVQAEARLELAEIAREAGDLTTACEHWQIARALFFDEGGKTEVAAVEDLMHRHGCPTDWVLNDF